MRKRIFEIIGVAHHKSDWASRVYDYFLITVIIISIIPIITNLSQPITLAIESFALVIFIGDYLLRWITADFRYKSKTPVSFLRYPFSFSSILNLLVIISLLPIDYSGSALGLMEIFRVVQICHVFRLASYSKSLKLISKVFRRQKNALLTVAVFALFYILVSALVVFSTEPTAFDSFFDAIYWATAALTTVGFGDMYPVSTIGRAISMISSLLGILVVALPTGIITAGYVKIVNEQKRKQCQETTCTPDKK